MQLIFELHKWLKSILPHATFKVIRTFLLRNAHSHIWTRAEDEDDVAHILSFTVTDRFSWVRLATAVISMQIEGKLLHSYTLPLSVNFDRIRSLYVGPIFVFEIATIFARWDHNNIVLLYNAIIWFVFWDVIHKFRCNVAVCLFQLLYISKKNNGLDFRFPSNIYPEHGKSLTTMTVHFLLVCHCTLICL